VLTLPLQATACPKLCNKSPFSAFKKERRKEEKKERKEKKKERKNVVPEGGTLPSGFQKNPELPCGL
jgi:hypothetical protein